MAAFSHDPDPEVRELVARAEKLGWFDEEPAPLPPILRETWDEGGWPVTKITFELGHILAAGLHPRDFNSTAAERLEVSIEQAVEGAWSVLQGQAARRGNASYVNEPPSPFEFPLGSAERIAAEILDHANAVRTMITERAPAADLAEMIQRLEQKRIALRDLVAPHPKDGPAGRSTVHMVESAAAQKAAPQNRLPKWLIENQDKLTGMRIEGNSPWKMAGFIARKYDMDQNSLATRIKKLIAVGNI